MDFESISLAARTHCHVAVPSWAQQKNQDQAWPKLMEQGVDKPDTSQSGQGEGGGGKARKCCSSERVETLFGSQQRGAGAKLAEVLEMGLEPTISSLGGRRLIH